MKQTFVLVLAMVGSGLACATAAEKQIVVTPEHSRIEIDVKATMGSFVGSLSDYDAAIIVDDATSEVKSAVLEFKFNAVQTGEEKRDGHMHAWQETEKYPDGRFELLRLEPSSDATHTAIGRLTLHGQTNEIRFPVTILNEGNMIVIDGEAQLDTQTFGLPIIRKFLALKVNPLVTVRFHLQGKVPAAS